MYTHSVKCFNEWGALAVSGRIDAYIKSYFGPDTIAQIENDGFLDTMMQNILGGEKDATRKRQVKVVE